MKNKDRFMSLVLTLVLLSAMTISVVAASGPKVEYGKDAAASQTVRVSNLSGNCYGVQVVLTLDSQPTGFDVQFCEAVTGPGTSYTYKTQGNDVTLYVASKVPLNQGGTLDLANLTAAGAFTIVSYSGLKLLDADYAGETGSDTPPSQNPGDDTPPSQNPGDDTPPSQNPGDNTPPSQNPGGDTPPSQNPGNDTPSSNPPTSSNTPGGGSTQVGPTTVRRPTSTSTPATGDSTSTTPPEQKPEAEVKTPPPFTDVADSAWYYDAVCYAYENGLMNGVSATSFAPDGVTTRAQIVTILYRLEGQPKGDPVGFTDVPEGQWYSDSINWAGTNGIVNGYGNGTFGPNDPITREQMAAILYRYADWKQYDVRERAELSGYTDADSISPFAVEAMSWANEKGLITGVSETELAPGGNATRAQSATILMRFCHSFQNKVA